VTPTAPMHVVVAVPARDEADGIAATLRSVCASLDEARRRGLVRSTLVEVAAHRCVDLTASRAVEVLRGRRGCRVTRDDDSVTVGEVRDLAVRRALARLARPGPPASGHGALRRTWVLSTDADTCVAPGWVRDILAEAARTGAVGVVGLAPLDVWQGGAAGAASYERLLAAKMREDPVHQHDHVYGANLAVRADAYLDVGGFSHVRHGEDQALVDALAARGHALLRTRAITVTTSGRLRGRAAGGLAERLATIDREARAGDAPALGVVETGLVR
jgi:hypothetical protein